jgi:ABC-type polysaccharide/polyol phosphate export permease
MQESIVIALRTEARVIHALIMREILTRYGRHNIGFLWLFLEPIIFTVGVTILWNLIKHPADGGISVTNFVLTGYSSILLWRNMPSRCLGAISPNSALLYHRNVKIIDIYVSRIILEGLGATFSFLILSIILIACNLMNPPNDTLALVEGWFYLFLYAAGLSLLIGTLSEQSDLVEKLWHPIMYFLIPFSGSFFFVDDLPPVFASWVLINPTVHCTEMVREGFFGNAHRWHYDRKYLVFSVSALLLAALWNCRVLSKKVTLES